jgi:hypothetical protein
VTVTLETLLIGKKENIWAKCDDQISPQKYSILFHADYSLSWRVTVTVTISDLYAQTSFFTFERYEHMPLSLLF